jgi:hypothetical protein
MLVVLRLVLLPMAEAGVVVQVLLAQTLQQLMVVQAEQERHPQLLVLL